MIKLLEKASPKALLGYLHPLRGSRSPNLAAFIGFVLGGLGLGLYFWSFIDALLPLVIFVVLFLGVKELAAADTLTAALSGALVAALYGYLRASDSNRRLGPR